MEAYDEHWALQKAVEAGCKAQCEKSKRGVIIWIRETGDYVYGFNSPPDPFRCTGTDACRGNCNKIVVHAEQSAIISAGSVLSKDIKSLFHRSSLYELELEMIHVKVIDGKAAFSGSPSCWQCSRLILDAGIKSMWLFHEDGLKEYPAYEFHKLTLEHCGLAE